MRLPNCYPVSDPRSIQTVTRKLPSLLILTLIALLWVTPTWADDPLVEIGQTTWEPDAPLCAPERCSTGSPDQVQTTLRLDKLDAAVVAIKVEVWWVWEGRPDQQQPNEHFQATFQTDEGTQMITCPDFGDAGTPPQLCGDTEMYPHHTPYLAVTLTHGDVGQCAGRRCPSSGSVRAKVVVTWYTEAIAGSVTARKLDEQGNPWSGVTIELHRGGQLVQRRVSDSAGLARFSNLPLGDYTLREIPLPDSVPLGPTQFDFTLTATAPHFEAAFQNSHVPHCTGVEVDYSAGRLIVQATHTSHYRLVDSRQHPVSDSQPDPSFNIRSLLVGETYQIQVRNSISDWITSPTCAFRLTSQTDLHAQITCQGAIFSGQVAETASLSYTTSDGEQGTQPVEDAFTVTVPWNPASTGQPGRQSVWATANLTRGGQMLARAEARRDDLVCLQATTCALETVSDAAGQTWYWPYPIHDATQQIHLTYRWRAESNFGFGASALAGDKLPITVAFPDKPGHYWVQFEINIDGQWLAGDHCWVDYQVESPPLAQSQGQDFIGAVAFGTFTPQIEPGKEYFDGTRSLMFNAEYLTSAGQADLVFRFNGQEVDDTTLSLFNQGSFRQLESEASRTVTQLEDGVTKLIAYRYGQEQARIFQTNQGDHSRWIHPLDQPFEHKYDFALELHGPAQTTDLLVYQTHQQPVTYDDNGVALVNLTYTEPGLVALYQTTDGLTPAHWTTVDAFTPAQPTRYSFSETGLYHYRLLDPTGQVVAGPAAHPTLEAQPGQTLSAQLAYPQTSLFVGLYDEMQFQHPDFWTMPIDARAEHDHEFHLDYQRDANGDLVIEALYLLNATTSVAQQFPYGRHDGLLPGLNLIGIPDVSMVAYCARPGYHEVVYWGGWENESYYLPTRSWVYDAEAAQEWSLQQQQDCLDAAQRVNQELARQGLRTDHTHRHHGERSQGYQLIQHNAWSPYNLVGLRPPHIGRFLKPGTVLRYTHTPEESLFWGWDLTQGTLQDGLTQTALQDYITHLGPVHYIDHTGSQPADALNRW